MIVAKINSANVSFISILLLRCVSSPALDDLTLSIESEMFSILFLSDAVDQHLSGRLINSKMLKDY